MDCLYLSFVNGKLMGGKGLPCQTMRIRQSVPLEVITQKLPLAVETGLSSTTATFYLFSCIITDYFGNIVCNFAHMMHLIFT